MVTQTSKSCQWVFWVFVGWFWGGFSGRSGTLGPLPQPSLGEEGFLQGFCRFLSLVGRCPLIGSGLTFPTVVFDRRSFHPRAPSTPNGRDRSVGGWVQSPAESSTRRARPGVIRPRFRLRCCAPNPPGPPPTAHRPPPTAHRPPPTAYRLPPTAYRLPPTAYRRGAAEPAEHTDGTLRVHRAGVGISLSGR